MSRRLEWIPLEELTPAQRNPKRHNLDVVRASVDRFGFTAPAIRDERTGRLVVGHGRTEVLRQMADEGQEPPSGLRTDKQGRWLVPVVCGWASRSDAEAQAYLVADNQHTVLGGWDYTELDELLAQVQDADPELVALIGFDRDEVADLVKANEAPDLDQLAAQVGEPDPADTWPVVRLQVPPQLAAAWRSHLDTHNGNEVQAFAELLEVDPADLPEGQEG